MLAARSPAASAGTLRRATAVGAAAAPRRLVLSVPLPRRGAAVVRRFKEDDDTEAQIAKRRETEELIRKQEKLMQEANRNTRNVAGSAKEELKKDVSRVVDTVDRSSAGKGYSSAVRVPIWMPAFTRRREIFVGRIAMVGFAATCALEIFTAQHLGPIQQVCLWSGLEPPTVVAILTGIVMYNILGGLGPWSPTFAPENLRDVAKRPAGPPNTMVNPLDLRAFLGISGWGFTKRNELFHARLAMLGFAAAVLNEIKTGQGALAQVAGYLNVVPDNVYYSTVLNGFFAFTALMLACSIFFPSRLQGAGASEEEIY